MLGAYGVTTCRSAAAAPPELGLPPNVPEERFDFEAGSIEGWTVVNGQWAVEEMAGEGSGKRVLVQRATRNEFNAWRRPVPTPIDYRDSRFRRGRVGRWTKADSITAFDDVTIRGAAGSG
jgi:hypothetical protein